MTASATASETEMNDHGDAGELAGQQQRQAGDEPGHHQHRRQDRHRGEQHAGDSLPGGPAPRCRRAEREPGAARRAGAGRADRGDRSRPRVSGSARSARTETVAAGGARELVRFTVRCPVRSSQPLGYPGISRIFGPGRLSGISHLGGLGRVSAPLGVTWLGLVSSPGLVSRLAGFSPPGPIGRVGTFARVTASVRRAESSAHGPTLEGTANGRDARPSALPHPFASGRDGDSGAGQGHR